MRDLALTLFIPFSFLWGLTSNQRGLMVLNWICFMRPYDFSYGLWNTVPTFKVALAVAMGSALWHGQFRLKLPPFLMAYLAFLGWLTLCCVTAFRPEIAWEWYTMFIITFWVVSIFMFAAINTLETLKWCLWVSAGSLTLLAAKVGLVLGAKGGAHVTSQIAGFVGDNNVFGLTLCLALSTSFGLRKTIPKKFMPVFYGIWAAGFMCVVFTKSRGAFLTTAVIFLLSAGTSRNPVRNVIILLVVAFTAYTAIPKEFFDRLSTFENIEEDDSAMSRILFWHISWLQALERPVFGVGPDNHMAYNEAFYGHMISGKTNHVAHSVYFQVIAETGFVGMALYLTLVLWTAWELIRLYWFAKGLRERHPDLAWVEATAFWMRNGFIGYLFGSAFLNMLVFDFPWYFMWYAHMFRPMLERELEKRRRAQVKAMAAAESAVDPPGAPPPRRRGRFKPGALPGPA